MILPPEATPLLAELAPRECGGARGGSLLEPPTPGTGLRGE
jgi:hypothetical protein